MKKTPKNGQKKHIHIHAILRRGTAFFFLVLLFLGSMEWFPWFKGGTTGTRLFDTIPFSDPLAAIEVFLAGGVTESMLWVGVGILVLLALFLGPVFCGWICPLGLLLDINEFLNRKIRHRLHRRGRKGLPLLSPPDGLRFPLLLFVLSFSFFAGFPLFQTVSPINLLGWGIVYGAWGGLSLLLVLLALEWALPRLWCRSLCPLGGLYSLLGQFAPFRVCVSTSRAGKALCGLCTTNCPMGIQVMESFTTKGFVSINDPRCTRCGACIDVCPKTVLTLGFCSSGKGFSPLPESGPNRPDSSLEKPESCLPGGAHGT
jgi:ferredoxin-type protein NapH